MSAPCAVRAATPQASAQFGVWLRGGRGETAADDADADDWDGDSGDGDGGLAAGARGGSSRAQTQGLLLLLLLLLCAPLAHNYWRGCVPFQLACSCRVRQQAWHA